MTKIRNAHGPSPSPLEVLLFELAEQRFALPLSFVIEITRGSAVRRVPNVPVRVLGVLNRRGRMIAVLDLREHLGLPSAALSPEQHFVFVRVQQNTLALRVDRAIGVERLALLDAPELLEAPDSLRGHGGLASVEHGVVLIYDPERFLSPAQQRELEQALSLARSGAIT